MVTSQSHSGSSIVQFGEFARGAESEAAIEGFLALMPRPPRFARYRQYVVFHRGDLANLIEEELSWWYPQLQRINQSAPVFELSMEVGREKDQKVAGVFVILPSSEPDLHRIITISHSAFWNRAVRKLVRTLYPRAMPVFFKQDETRDSLLSLQSSLDEKHRIVVTEVTMKRKKQDKPPLSRRRIETDRLWTELTIDEVYQRALEWNQWFTSIGFNVERLRRDSKRYLKIASGRIYKRGDIHYDFLHDHISRDLIPVLERQSQARLQMLRGRGIRERRYVAGSPIEIEYSAEIFSDEEEVRRFGDVMSKYPHSTRAVFHPNPYYHASIADFMDGSSFELWVLSPQRILIVPQAKSTEQAFQRLISHIFFEFREGEVHEYSG